jgi:hypothetical protein
MVHTLHLPLVEMDGLETSSPVSSLSPPHHSLPTLVVKSIFSTPRLSCFASRLSSSLQSTSSTGRDPSCERDHPLLSTWHWRERRKRRKAIILVPRRSRGQWDRGEAPKLVWSRTSEFDPEVDRAVVQTVVSIRQLSVDEPAWRRDLLVSILK